MGMVVCRKAIKTSFCGIWHVEVRKAQLHFQSHHQQMRTRTNTPASGLPGPPRPFPDLTPFQHQTPVSPPFPSLARIKC